MSWSLAADKMADSMDCDRKMGVADVPARFDDAENLRLSIGTTAFE